MPGPRYALRKIFGTSRGARQLAVHVLVGFGFVSGVVQFVGQLFPSVLREPGAVALASLLLCVAWGFTRAWPRSRIRHRFQRSDMAVVIEVGDLFDQDAHFVVGFSDTFDTSMVDNEVINSSSVQGQLVHRLYDGDARRLDVELSRALREIRPVSSEDRNSKAKGKLWRYPLGTVAVVGSAHRKVFAVAYSRMSNDLVARSSVEWLWLSLSHLWETICRHAPYERVAMPLVGSGLARLDFLDRQSLLKMILLSFVSRTREQLVCRELRVVIHPSDLESIDLLAAGEFLRAL